MKRPLGIAMLLLGLLGCPLAFFVALIAAGSGMPLLGRYFHELMFGLLFAPLVLVPIGFTLASMPTLPRHRSRTHCTQCKYNMRGNESGICPECGHVMHADRA